MMINSRLYLLIILIFVPSEDGDLKIIGLSKLNVADL
jgi:hypothetical protein